MFDQTIAVMSDTHPGASPAAHESPAQTLVVSAGVLQLRVSQLKGISSKIAIGFSNHSLVLENITSDVFANCSLPGRGDTIGNPYPYAITAEVSVEPLVHLLHYLLPGEPVTFEVTRDSSTVRISSCGQSITMPIGRCSIGEPLATIGGGIQVETFHFYLQLLNAASQTRNDEVLLGYDQGTMYIKAGSGDRNTYRGYMECSMAPGSPPDDTWAYACSSRELRSICEALDLDVFAKGCYIIPCHEIDRIIILSGDRRIGYSIDAMPYTIW